MPIYREVNKDFFKKWTPQMAYVLGFFAADGYMTKSKRGGCFWNIQITDKDLLGKIRKAIGSNHKISLRKTRANESPLYRLQIGSKEMFGDLTRLGMRQNKTKSLCLPKVSDIYLGDFVRGYFDGDGHVWVGYVHKERETQTLVIQTVFTSCSDRFLRLLKIKLNENGVAGGFIIRNKKKNYCRLAFSINGSLKLYKIMYNASDDLYLIRKKAVFDRYIKMRS